MSTTDLDIPRKITQAISGEADYVEVNIDTKLSLCVRVPKDSVAQARELAKLRAQMAEQIRALSAPLRKGSGLVWFNVGKLS